MDTALRVRLPVSETAPALARRALDALDGELEGLRESARLLVSELVTNAVRHAGLGPQDEIELEVATRAFGVRIRVSAPSEGFVPPGRPDGHLEGGFGLYFVDTLADRWGVERRAVWFELDRRARTSCVRRSCACSIRRRAPHPARSSPTFGRARTRRGSDGPSARGPSGRPADRPGKGRTSARRDAVSPRTADPDAGSRRESRRVPPRP